MKKLACVLALICGFTSLTAVSADAADGDVFDFWSIDSGAFYPNVRDGYWDETPASWGVHDDLGESARISVDVVRVATGGVGPSRRPRGRLLRQLVVGRSKRRGHNAAVRLLRRDPDRNRPFVGRPRGS